MIVPVIITVGILGALALSRSREWSSSGSSGSGSPGPAEAVPSQPLASVKLGDEVIIPLKSEQGAPEFRIPAGTEAAILRVEDVTSANVSGPLIGYTQQANYLGNLLVGLMSFGTVADRRAPFNLLSPPGGPVTVRRSAIQRVYPAGTVAREIAKQQGRS